MDTRAEKTDTETSLKSVFGQKALTRTQNLTGEALGLESGAPIISAAFITTLTLLCNLILGTQRPDATIIPPQVRSNCDYRVCGRADDTLSKIILDNTSASDAVPIDVAGRFIAGDGTIFQGYYYDV